MRAVELPLAPPAALRSVPDFDLPTASWSASSILRVSRGSFARSSASLAGARWVAVLYFLADRPLILEEDASARPLLLLPEKTCDLLENKEAFMLFSSSVMRLC